MRIYDSKHLFMKYDLKPTAEIRIVFSLNILYEIYTI